MAFCPALVIARWTSSWAGKYVFALSSSISAPSRLLSGAGGSENDPGIGGPGVPGVEGLGWASRMSLVPCAHSSAGVVGRAVDSMVGTRFGAVVVAVIVWCVGMREAECEVIGVKG